MFPWDGARWKHWAEAFRLWLPLVISLCAISLTVFQAMSTRRHTRLSVQPRIDWRVMQDAATGSLAFSLVNVGFGPAVMEEVVMFFDGETLGPIGTDTCAELARRIGREGDTWDTDCSAIEGEYVLRPGDSLTLFASRPSPSATSDHRVSEADARKVSANARYCSFYDECWQVHES